jgi:hypothetical protein
MLCLAMVVAITLSFGSFYVGDGMNPKNMLPMLPQLCKLVALMWHLM